MRVLVVTSSFPRHGRDHAGRFVYELARALCPFGHRVEALAPEDPAVTPEALAIPAFRFPYFWPRSLQRLFYRSGAPENLGRDALARLQVPAAVAAFALEVARRSRSADVVLAHWLLPAGLAAALASLATGVPLVAVAHSSDVHLLSRTPGGRALARFIAARAHAVCAVAADVAGRVRALGIEAAVLPLGVEPLVASARRRELRRRFGLAGRRLIVGLGRLEPIKGYDVLLEAVRGAEGATLVLAGDGSERARLAARARSAGVDLRLPGFVTGPAKADLLRACDLAAFPSRRLPDGRSEGLPVALLEALSAGAPVVASAVGGIPEALGDAGVLAPPGDPIALREAIFRALARRAALSVRARRRAEPFAIAHAGRRYHALLEEAVRA